MTDSFSDESASMTRRQFMRITAAGTAGLALAGWSSKQADALQKYPHWGKAVVARDEAATDGEKINKQVVRSMLDEAIHVLTDGGGWPSLFPTYKTGETVAIKINSVARMMPTHREVVDAIVDGLGGIGVRPSGIIVWDTYAFTMSAAKYASTDDPSSVRMMSGDELKDGYDQTKPVDIKGETALLSRILTQAIHLINAPVLKDHWEAGITFALKNHVGSVDRPKKVFHHPPDEGNMLHSILGRGKPKDDCIAMINAAPDIREKTRLIVGDALFGVYKGGPIGSPQFVHNGLIVGTDPVATDHQARLIIDKERAKHGTGPTNPLHLEHAIRLGLGAPIGEIQIARINKTKKR